MTPAFIRRLLLFEEGLLSTALASFVVRALSALAHFAMTLAIARMLGPAGAGVFFLGQTIINVAAIISRFGMDNSLMRFASPLWERRDYQSLIGTGLQGAGISLVCGAVLSAFFVLMSEAIATRLFSKPELIATLKILSTAIVPLSLLWVLSGLLKGMRLPAWANLLEAGYVPGVVAMTVLLLVGLKIEPSVSETAGIYAIACSLAAIAAAFVIARRIPSSCKPIYGPWRGLLTSGLPLMWAAILNYFALWSPSLFLGVYAGSESFAHYSVAHRTAVLISFILVVFNSITAPRFAALFGEGRLEELKRLASNATTVVAATALPALLIILLFPGTVVSAFGEEFRDAAPLLVIMSLGQFVNIATGSVGYILMMTGQERQIRNVLVITAGVSVLLSNTLIPAFGAKGAAISTAITLALQNILAAWYVYRQLGVWIRPGRLVRRSGPPW